MTTSITSELENYATPEKWDTETLVLFLKEQDLKLDDDDYEILRKRKIVGVDFLEMTEEKFMQAGLEMGPAMRLAKEVKALKDNTKRAFSSYRSLEEVLAKYGIKGNSITKIPQFKPVTQEIDENSPAFKLCIDDILRRLKNMGPVVDNNEAMRCEYVSTILHTAVSLLEGLTISPQASVSGIESSGRVDYAIKKIIDDLLEEIICITEGKQNLPGIGVAQNIMQCKSSCDTNLDMIKKKRKADEAFEDYEYVYGVVSMATDWYFLLYTTEGIYATTKTEYRISLTEEALEDPTELRKNVKRVLEVIVGLLKDRMTVSGEPAIKKRRVQEKIKKR